MSKFCTYGNGDHYHFGDRYENVFNKYYMGADGTRKHANKNTETNHWHIATNYYVNPCPLRQIIYYKPILGSDHIEQAGMVYKDGYGQPEHEDDQLSLVGFMETKIPLQKSLGQCSLPNPNPFHKGEQLFSSMPGVPFFLTKTAFLENSIPSQTYCVRPVLYDQTPFYQPKAPENYSRHFHRDEMPQPRKQEWSEVYADPQQQYYYQQEEEQVENPFNPETEALESQDYYDSLIDAPNTNYKHKTRRLQKKYYYNEDGCYLTVESEEESISDPEFEDEEPLQDIPSEDVKRSKAGSSSVQKQPDPNCVNNQNLIKLQEYGSQTEDPNSADNQNLVNLQEYRRQTNDPNSIDNQNLANFQEYRRLRQAQRNLYHQRLLQERLAALQKQQYYEKSGYSEEEYQNNEELVQVIDNTQSSPRTVEEQQIRYRQQQLQARHARRSMHGVHPNPRIPQYNAYLQGQRQMHQRRRDLQQYYPQLEPHKEESVEYIHAPNPLSNPSRQFTVAYDSQGNRYYGSPRNVAQIVARFSETAQKDQEDLEANALPEDTEQQQEPEASNKQLSMHSAGSQSFYDHKLDYQRKKTVNNYTPVPEEHQRPPTPKQEPCGSRKKLATLRSAKFHDVRLEDVCDSNSTVNSSVESSHDVISVKTEVASSSSSQKLPLKEGAAQQELIDSSKPESQDGSLQEDPVRLESSSGQSSSQSLQERGRSLTRRSSKAARLRKSPAREQMELEEPNEDEKPCLEQEPSLIQPQQESAQGSEKGGLQEDEEAIWISATDVEFKQEEMQSVTASDPVSTDTSSKNYGNEVISVTSDGSKLLSANTIPSGKTISSRSSTKSRLNSEVTHMMSRLEEIQCILMKKNVTRQKGAEHLNKDQNQIVATVEVEHQDKGPSRHHSKKDIRVVVDTYKMSKNESSAATNKHGKKETRRPYRRSSDQHTRKEKEVVKISERASRSLPETNKALLQHFKLLVQEKEAKKLKITLSEKLVKSSKKQKSSEQLLTGEPSEQARSSTHLKKSQGSDRSINQDATVRKSRSSNKRKPSKKFVDSHPQNSSSTSLEYSEANNPQRAPTAVSVVSIFQAKTAGEDLPESSGTHLNQHQIEALLDHEDLRRVPADPNRRQSNADIAKLKRKSNRRRYSGKASKAAKEGTDGNAGPRIASGPASGLYSFGKPPNNPSY